MATARYRHSLPQRGYAASFALFNLSTNTLGTIHNIEKLIFNLLSYEKKE